MLWRGSLNLITWKGKLQLSYLDLTGTRDVAYFSLLLIGSLMFVIPGPPRAQAVWFEIDVQHSPRICVKKIEGIRELKIQHYILWLRLGTSATFGARGYLLRIVKCNGYCKLGEQPLREKHT